MGQLQSLNMAVVLRACNVAAQVPGVSQECLICNVGYNGCSNRGLSRNDACRKTHNLITITRQSFQNTPNLTVAAPWLNL